MFKFLVMQRCGVSGREEIVLPGGGCSKMQVPAKSGLAKSPNNVFVVHVMKPVLVQKRRRCSASQVADF